MEIIFEGRAEGKRVLVDYINLKEKSFEIVEIEEGKITTIEL
ncbi:TPA: hypothetical protein ACGOZ9_001593 [Streptococcus suis]|nr:hypothetical protein [Streptococcus suis]